VAVDAHNDQVGAVIGSAREDHLADLGVGCDVALDSHFDAVSTKPESRIRAWFGTMGIRRRLGIDRQKDDLLCRLGGDLIHLSGLKMMPLDGVTASVAETA
jgi:hypothetical protein